MQTISLDKSFDFNICALSNVLRKQQLDQSIEANIDDQKVYMESTGNPMDDDTVTLIRAEEYGLITSSQQDALWDLFVTETLNKQKGI